MNSETYNNYLDYLSNLTFADTVTNTERELIRKTANNYFIRNFVLYRRHRGKERLVVPEHKKQMILEASHDHQLAGHMGVDNTYQRLSDKYYWKEMYEDIREYVKNCDTCQKRRRDKDIDRLQPIPPTSAFDHIGIDIVGPLPRTLRGNRYIVVAVDYLTKYPEARALPLADALNIAPFIYEDIICRHGIPRELMSDRGTEFLNNLIEMLTQHFGIRHIQTTAYHPQGNGLTERTNQTIKNTIAKAVQSQGGDWDLYLPSALFALRTMKQETTKFTPFELTYGRKAKQLADQLMGTNSTETGTWEQQVEHRAKEEIQELHRIRNKAKEFIAVAQERQKKNYDKLHKEVEKLKIGDLVLLYRNIVESSWSAKLDPKWEGPYYIASIKGTTYQLRRKSGTILPFTVHRNRLKKYHDAKVEQLPGGAASDP